MSNLTVYVVQWVSDLPNGTIYPAKVMTYKEWFNIPRAIRKCYRYSKYSASDPLDAYKQALKEQTDA